MRFLVGALKENIWNVPWCSSSMWKINSHSCLCILMHIWLFPPDITMKRICLVAKSAGRWPHSYSKPDDPPPKRRERTEIKTDGRTEPSAPAQRLRRQAEKRPSSLMSPLVLWDCVELGIEMQRWVEREPLGHHDQGFWFDPHLRGGQGQIQFWSWWAALSIHRGCHTPSRFFRADPCAFSVWSELGWCSG